ncbi:MAG: hypothetical protein ACYDDB_06400 [bacterium]
MIAINVTPLIGGKYVSTAYAVYNKLNPFISIILITVSETLLCSLLFYAGVKLKSLKWLHKMLSSKKSKKAHNYVAKYGSIIGLFVGQMFIGAPPISLALGVLYEREKNIYTYFFIPLFVSIFLYSIFNFYLNSVAITSLKNIFHLI